MNTSKSLWTRLGETFDEYRADRRRAQAQDPEPHQPDRLRCIVRWLTPNGGTLLLVAALILTQQVWARPLASPAAPGPSATTVNYQGRLADSGGAPLDGTYGMSFSLWDAATDGNLVWGPENHAAVPVSQGLFSVGLGSQTSGGIPTSAWNGDRYLEITVGGETLSPRELIRSVPIAGMALTVPEGAIGTEQIADGAVTSDKLDSHLCCGHTNVDGTGWVDYGSAGIYIDADTSTCDFSTTPMYFTSLGGRTHHFSTVGATSIYHPSASGFRVYLRPSASGDSIDSAQADDDDWYIQWCGIEK